MLVGVYTLLVICWFTYCFAQFRGYQEERHLTKLTIKDFESKQPKRGWIEISGGRLAYERVRGSDYFAGSTLYPVSSFFSFVPYVDMDTKKPILLVALTGQGMEPEVLFKAYATHPGLDQVMGMIEEKPLDPKILDMFAKDGYPLAPTIPVLEMAGAPTPEARNRKVLIATVLAALIGGGPWAVKAWKDAQDQPRKRKKRKGWQASGPSRY